MFRASGLGLQLLARKLKWEDLFCYSKARGTYYIGYHWATFPLVEVSLLIASFFNLQSPLSLQVVSLFLGGEMGGGWEDTNIPT